MPITKITVKVHEKLMQTFNRQVDELFLMRDAFLNHMIRRETPSLAHDLQGKKLSPAARKYIAGSLKRVGTTTVNIKVERETADALNKVVEETNMVRDAFVNRLILFLRSSKFVTDFFELPEFITYSAFESIVDPMPTSPMKAIEAVHADPLFYMRTAIEERHKTGLYLVPFPPQLAGFECYIEDDRVPGTPAYEEQQRLLDEALAELGAFEKDAFTKPKEKAS